MWAPNGLVRLRRDPAQIRAIFAEHTPIIEPLSLDEAYLDVTENLKGIASATGIAEEIQTKIHAETRPHSLRSVSYNKFLAKLASDKAGWTLCHHTEKGARIRREIAGRGVGLATAAKMNRLGIATGLDLRKRTLAFLQQHFGKAGPYFYWMARGVDERPVGYHTHSPSSSSILGRQDPIFIGWHAASMNGRWAITGSREEGVHSPHRQLEKGVLKWQTTG